MKKIKYFTIYVVILFGRIKMINKLIKDYKWTHYIFLVVLRECFNLIYFLSKSVTLSNTTYFYFPLLCFDQKFKIRNLYRYRKKKMYGDYTIQNHLVLNLKSKTERKEHTDKYKGICIYIGWFKTEVMTDTS